MRKQAKEPPPIVVAMLCRRGCRDFEWISCGDERWNGYAHDHSGKMMKRVLITVVLVTGKAVVEVLSPDYGFDVLIRGEQS